MYSRHEDTFNFKKNIFLKYASCNYDGLPSFPLSEKGLAVFQSTCYAVFFLFPWAIGKSYPATAVERKGRKEGELRARWVTSFSFPFLGEMNGCTKRRLFFSLISSSFLTISTHRVWITEEEGSLSKALFGQSLRHYWRFPSRLLALLLFLFFACGDGETPHLPNQ